MELIFTLLTFLLLGTSGKADYCCDFNVTNCYWLNVAQELTWSWSGFVKPNISSSPDFIPPLNDDNYIWLQEDMPGKYTGEIITPLIELSEGDNISISIYLYSEKRDSKFSIIFYNPDFGVLVNDNPILNSGWSFLNITCGTVDKALPCCTEYPCYGWFAMTGVLSDPRDLFAIDSFIINECGPNSTSSPMPTLPTTTPITTVTEKTTTTTKVTTATPTTTVTTHPTTTATPTTAITTHPTTTATPTTTVTTHPTTTATPTTTTTTPTTTITTHPTTTTTHTTTTATQPTTTVTSAPTSTVTTSSTPPPTPNSFCGTFDNNTDGWTINDWSWSKTSDYNHTNIPAFTWNSPYMWTQSAKGGLLISPVVSASSGTIYSLDYFIYLQDPSMTNKLTVYFQPVDSSQMFTLILILDNTPSWQTVSGKCSVNTPCCDIYPCQGQFYLGSVITSGAALYAVDNVQMGDGCGKLN